MELFSASDDAVIGSGFQTITASASASVHNITSNSPITLSGGTLTIGGTVQVNNTFTINGGKLSGGTVSAGSGGQGITAGTSTNSVLDAVIVNTGIDLSATNAFLGVKDGLTLNGTATVTGTSAATLDFENTETLATVTGGTILLQNPGALDVEAGTTVTLGSGITVHGTGTVGQQYLNLGARTLVNQGTISADVSGARLLVATGIYNQPLTFSNSGTARAVGGASLQIDPSHYSSASSTGTLSVDGSGSTLILGGSWTNTGTLIATNGGTCNLTGTFLASDFGTFNTAGGSVVVNGTINIPHSNTLTLDGATTGSWTLDGGKIIDGILNFAGGAALGITASHGNLWDGVTLAGNLTLGTPSAFLGIKDGLTVNGTLTLSGNRATLDVENSQTIGGTGSIDSESTMTDEADAAPENIDVEAGVAATLGPDLTIHGGNLLIGDEASAQDSTRSLLNNGTIAADNGGVTIAGGNLGFTNKGTEKTVGKSVLALPTKMLQGLVAAPSGTDLLFTWNGFGAAEAGSAFSLSKSLDGTNFTTISNPGPVNSPQVISGLAPNTGYYVKAEVDNADGSRVITQSASVSTMSQDQTGYYKVTNVTDPSGNPVPPSGGGSWGSAWQKAGSVASAMVQALGSLLQNPASPDWQVAAVPTGDGWQIGIWVPEDAGEWAEVGGNWGEPDGDEAVNFIGLFYVSADTQTPPPPSSGSNVAANPNGTGDNSNTTGQSTDPITYFNGGVVYNTTDLQSDGLGTSWTQSRSWTNLGQLTSTNVNGYGMVDSGLPSLQQVNGTATLMVVNDGSSARKFTYNTSTSQYVPTTYLQDTFASSGSDYVLTDTLGNKTAFYGFSSSYPPAQQGEFKSFTTAGGLQTYVAALTGSGNIAEIRRRDASAVDQESWLYTYNSSGDPNPGLLGSVQERRPNATGGIIRQVIYQYYQPGQSFGSPGDLKTASIEDSSGNIIDTEYYRYYVAGEANGFLHGLKYVFGGPAFARLAAAVSNPFTASDSDVVPFADHYFQYDDNRRVVLHTVAGAGGPDTGGLGTFTYAYSTSSNPDGTDSWQFKTVETLPDGGSNTVYCNSSGQVMLKVFTDVSDPVSPALDGSQWDGFYEYDSQGRVILQAGPSAITGYDETKADLLNNQSGNYQYLSDTSGAIYLTDYGSSTTAGTSAGDVAGYVKYHKVQQGELGTPILTDSQQYFAHTAGGATIYPVASITIYGNSDGTDARTTTSTYTWQGSTNLLQSVTVVAPPIASAQNGPATSSTDTADADTSTTFFDAYGNAAWTKDGGGFISYNQFDPLTGALLKHISDVSTADTPDFSNKPSGWTTPGGGGLELITAYTIDAFGRPTQIIDPNGNVTYMVYVDARQPGLDGYGNEVLVYPGWHYDSTLGKYTTTGPVHVAREYRPAPGAPSGQQTVYDETLTFTAPQETTSTPSGTETIDQTNIQSLSRVLTNDAGQVVEEDDYSSLSGLTYSAAAAHLSSALAGDNTQAGNYSMTIHAFDLAGRLNKVVDPNGTITRSIFDGLGRAASTWIGTTDTHTGSDWTPSTNTGNMIDVSDSVYDNGAVGDSLLTAATMHPGGGQADRTTLYLYDFRDRPIATKQGALMSGGTPNPSSETDGQHRLISFNLLDNLGETIGTFTYAADGVSLNDFAAWNLATTDASTLRSYSADSYDDQGRVYQATQYSVDPNTGAVSANGLVTNDFYDHRGNVIEESAPGGMVTKSTYDGADRLIHQYTTDGGVLNSPSTAGTWAAAGSVINDVVLQQSDLTYDPNGNVIETISRQRFDNDATSAAGPLGSPTSGIGARDYYSANYYDLANRLTDSLNVGTNGGSSWNPPASPPASDDTHLVNHTDYDSAGRVGDTVDPRGIKSGYIYDMLGHQLTTIAAWDPQNPTPTDSANQTTIYTYDAGGDVLTMTAEQSSGPDQVTGYVYGVNAGTGSAISSNDLLAKVEYPDKATGSADTTNASDWQQFGYNLLGDKISYTDQNGTTHAYGYDVLGRLTSDMVTAFGSGIDQSIVGLAYAFNDAGLPSEQDSLAPNGSDTYVSNSDTETYNGLGQITSYVQPSGSVFYIYTNITPGNGSRLYYMIYPSRGIRYLYGGVSPISEITYDSGSNTATVTTTTPTNYSVGSTVTIQGVSDSALNGQFTVTAASATQFQFMPTGSPGGGDYTAAANPDMTAVGIGGAGTVDDAISRVTEMQDVSSGTILAAYQYLGLSTVVQEDRPQPGVDLSYIQQTPATTDGGDRYTGLDRFGRVIDQNWVNPSSGAVTDRFLYGYDRDGNVLYENNIVNPTYSQVYTYDNLNRLSGYQQGTLNGTNDGIVGTLTGGQSYAMDALGNMTTYGPARTFNAQNQIASINGGGGPTYDAAGQMTGGIPIPNFTGQFIYDAWGRVVKVLDQWNETLITLSYDASGNHAATSTTFTFYPSYSSVYSPSGQVLEDDGYGGNLNGGSTITRVTYVWGVQYVNDLVSEDQTHWAFPYPTDRVYMQHDLNFSVTSVIKSDGSLQTGFMYDPYGNQSVTYGFGNTQADYNIGFQGGQYDVVMGAYKFGARIYLPQLGVWNRQDPAGAAGSGTNLYEAMGDSPVSELDPSGLCSDKDTSFSGAPGGGGDFGRWSFINDMPDFITGTPDQQLAVKYGLMGYYLQQQYNNAVAQGQYAAAHWTNDPFGPPPGVPPDIQQRIDSLAAAGKSLMVEFNSLGLDQVSLDSATFPLGGEGSLGTLYGTGWFAAMHAGYYAATASVPGMSSSAFDIVALVAPLAGKLVDVVDALAAEAATTTTGRGLNVLNSTFKPNADAVMNNLIDQVNSKLAANPSLAKSVLSDGEYASGQASSGLAAMQYGNAVERLAAREIANDSNLSVMFQHWGGPGQPDFATIGQFQGSVYDVTTPLGALSKGGRWYGQMIDPITYSRPSGFTVFP